MKKHKIRFAVPGLILVLVVVAVAFFLNAMSTNSVLAQTDDEVKKAEVVETTNPRWYTVTLQTEEVTTTLNHGDEEVVVPDLVDDGAQKEYHFEITYTVDITTWLFVQFRTSNLLSTFAAGGLISDCSQVAEPRGYRCYYQVTPDTPVLDLKVRWPAGSYNIVMIESTPTNGGTYDTSVVQDFSGEIYLPITMR